MQKSLMFNKKAEMNKSVIAGLGIVLGAVIIFGLLGIVGGFMGLIQEEVQNDVGLEVNVARTVLNENGYVNNTGYTLAGASVTGFTGVSAVTIINASGLVLTSTNYTITNGVVKNASIRTFNTVKINYTYNYNTVEGTFAYNNSQKAFESQQTIYNKMPLVALVIIIVIILGSIIGVVALFMNLGRNKAQMIG